MATKSGDHKPRFFVAVHVGAGYHAPSNEKALRSAMKRACLAAASVLGKVFLFFSFLFINHSLSTLESLFKLNNFVFCFFWGGTGWSFKLGFWWMHRRCYSGNSSVGGDKINYSPLECLLPS